MPVISFKQWIALSIVLPSLAMALGCSSNSKGADAGPSAIDKACADDAAAICALRNSCSTFDLNRDYPDEASCIARTTTSCISNLGAPHTGNTAANVELCAAAYPSEACADFFDSNPVAACVPPAGTLATSATCGASAQCASAYCFVGPDSICGTCQPLPAVGATCNVDSDCGRDLACEIASGATSGVCAAYAEVSAACLTDTKPCASGLACVGDNRTTGTMGVCQAAGSALGAACDSSRKTAANCDGALGFACIPTASGSTIGTCQLITLVAGGQPCGDIGSNPITGFADCVAGGLCVKATKAATTGTCAAPAADGASCDSDPSKGPPCLAPAKCVPTVVGATAGVCTQPNPTTCVAATNGTDAGT